MKEQFKTYREKRPELSIEETACLWYEVNQRPAVRVYDRTVLFFFGTRKNEEYTIVKMTAVQGIGQTYLANAPGAYDLCFWLYNNKTYGSYQSFKEALYRDMR